MKLVVKDDVSHVEYIGTRRAFGAFHPKTVIVDATGSGRPMQAIAQMDDPQALNFEACVFASGVMEVQPNVDLLWDAIAEVALAGNSSRLVGRSEAPSKDGKARIVMIERAAVERDCAEIGFGGVISALSELFEEEGGVFVADRSCYAVALWLATGMEASGKRYAMTFDSLQHSGVVRVGASVGAGQIEPIRTAYRAGTSLRVEMEWNNRHWNPISSGFILEGI